MAPGPFDPTVRPSWVYRPTDDDGNGPPVAGQGLVYDWTQQQWQFPDGSWYNGSDVNASDQTKAFAKVVGAAGSVPYNEGLKAYNSANLQDDWKDANREADNTVATYRAQEGGYLAPDQVAQIRANYLSDWLARMRANGFDVSGFTVPPVPAPPALFSSTPNAKDYPYEGSNTPTMDIAPRTFIAGDFARVTTAAPLALPSLSPSPVVSVAVGARAAVTDNHRGLIVAVAVLAVLALLFK